MRTSHLSRFAVPVLSLAVLVSSPAWAQDNGFHTGRVAPRGVPASVTSFGFGGHPGFHGVPASVTSQGFGAHIGFRGTPGASGSVGFGAPFHGRHGVGHNPFGREPEHRHRRAVGFYSPVYGYYAPYDYSADDNYVDDNDVSNEIQAQREYEARQMRENDYRAELDSHNQEAQPAPQPTSEPEGEPVREQPSTVLIFKDGHQVQIANYAIVGATLYDLSDDRAKKVQLADLDLPATVKENDQRGVEFQLPAQAKLN
jgi:hypothetical protein